MACRQWSPPAARPAKAVSLCSARGSTLDQIRQQAHEQARSELHAAVATLRDEFNAATSELHNEINTRLARLPLVKAWEPDAVHYTGDVVVHDGSVYQARKDTGKEPGHQDWILLARAGRDGCDGLTPNICGVFDARETYARLDIVQCDGASFVACHDNPGACPGDGWQILSKPGRRGPAGEIGPRGEKGNKGERGEAAPTIVSWAVDRSPGSCRARLHGVPHARQHHGQAPHVR